MVYVVFVTMLSARIAMIMYNGEYYQIPDNALNDIPNEWQTYRVSLQYLIPQNIVRAE